MGNGHLPLVDVDDMTYIRKDAMRCSSSQGIFGNEERKTATLQHGMARD